MQKIIQKFFVASVMIAGLFATSCHPNPIPKKVDPVNAVAEIIVSALDVESGKDVSNDSALKISASSSANSQVSVNGNVIKIEGSPEISQQTVTINAEFNGKKASATVQINALVAGGHAAYPANVLFEATQSQKEAKAIVVVSVWDYESASNVTAQSTFTPLGVPDSYSCKESDIKGTFVITGVGGISAFKFAVKATYGNAVGEAEVDIDTIAEGSEKAYLASITLGAPQEDEDKPAVATITVTAFDETLDADVTESTEISAALEDDSEASVKVEDNVVTITAGESLDIAAQDVTIYAKYGDESVEKVVALSNIKKNGSAEYTCEVVFNAGQGEDECTYSLRHVRTVTGASELLQLTQAHSHIYTHDYSHNGQNITNWLYNDSEFILNVDFAWTEVYGISDVRKDYAAGCTDDDKAKVDSYANTFRRTYTERKQTLSFQVSAYAQYTAFSVRTPSYSTYEVVRKQGTESSVVGTIKTTSWASTAEYLESSIPGHEGHYVPGHGHDDHGHGHGGNNAGGGIIGSE